MLAVADGHQGSAAACLAVEHALAHAPRWLERAPIALDERFRAEAEALVRGIHQQILGSSRRVGLAHHAGDRAGAAARGLARADLDRRQPALHARRAGTHRLQGALRDPPVFLGTARLDPAELSRPTFVDVRPLRGEHAVVLASDGFSQPGIGVTDPEATISRAVEEAARAGAGRASLALARGVVERAIEVQREAGVRATT